MPLASTNLGERLASVIPASRVQSDPLKLSRYAVDEIIPSAAVKPASAEEVGEIVRFAIKENLALVPCGNRTKVAIGMPPSRYDIALDMTALNQIAHYDPGDLTLGVDAGCNLATIDASLNPQNQFLPLPAAFGLHATVAGTIASGVDSPLRQSYGTARDFLVGAEFIDGTGAQCKSGGRVVKNVTGYDLHKLLIGSLGTLAIITRLNFRTFPSLTSSDSRSQVFCASFRTGNATVAFRQKITASPFTPYAVEIIDPEMNRLLSRVSAQTWRAPAASAPPSLSSTADGTASYVAMDWLVVVFFHGTAELLSRYAAALSEFAASAGATIFSTEVEQQASVFDAIRHLREAHPSATIFKIAQLPAKLPELFAALANIADHAKLPHLLFAHGIGITYFALALHAPGRPISTDNPVVVTSVVKACQEIFSVCASQSATAQIQFTPTQVKRRVNVFGPAREDLSAMRRLKSAFDPHNIFAPGRMLP
jgi:glycolate oxidase FAD binding subunit